MTNLGLVPICNSFEWCVLAKWLVHKPQKVKCLVQVAINALHFQSLLLSKLVSLTGEKSLKAIFDSDQGSNQHFCSFRQVHYQCHHRYAVQTAVRPIPNQHQQLDLLYEFQSKHTMLYSLNKGSTRCSGLQQCLRSKIFR